MLRQAMILAAGKGERMLPLSRNLPKPLFTVGDSTLIQIHLARLAAAGIEKVVINVHYLAEKIVTALGSEQFGMELVYSREAQLLETAGGIVAALPLLGDEPFIIVNGDIYTDYPFTNLHDVALDRLPHLVMVPNPAHHAQGDFAVGNNGLLQTEGDLLTYSGIGVYSARFFTGLAAERLMLRPLFDAAIAKNRLYGEVYRGVWNDIGTPERYLSLKSELG